MPSVNYREHGGPLFQKPHAQKFQLTTPAGTQSWTHDAFGGVESWTVGGIEQFKVTEIDLLGRPLEIEDASGTREIEYDNDKWTLVTVEWTTGPLQGFKLDEDADTRGRLGTLTVSKNFDDLYSVTHTYRGDSDRIDTLTVTTTGAPTVSIDVNGPGGMADQFNYTVNGQNTHTYSRSRNANGRFNGISAPGFSQGWNLDAMGRVKDLTTNGKTTTHGYHPINGSLASAVSADESRHYTFNNMGELEEEVIGTETLAMLADLNQSGALTERENPRKLTLYGTFHTNAVTEILVDTNVVHTTSVTPFSYTFDETTLPALTDTNAVVSLDWSVVGTRPEEPGGTPYEGGNAVAEIAGEHLFAPQAESVTYDIATRRASDAFLNYGWDAANQPLMLEERHGPHRTEHDYDGSQRRVEKRVYHHGNLQHTHRFVYDGWVPVVEEVEDQWGNFAYRNLYVWGPGPGGARQPEIGATGQLALIIHQPKHGPPQLSAPIYNHRLDVVGLVDVELGQVVARYGYTPFGKTTYAIGPRADQNPFRFAGAYHDQETDTYYFGYRHYHPRTKQWISRDPIGEAGGLNLFAYANNDPVNGIDVLGLGVMDFLGGVADSGKTFVVNTGQGIWNIGSEVVNSGYGILQWAADGPTAVIHGILPGKKNKLHAEFHGRRFMSGLSTSGEIVDSLHSETIQFTMDLLEGDVGAVLHRTNSAAINITGGSEVTNEERALRTLLLLFPLKNTRLSPASSPKPLKLKKATPPSFVHSVDDFISDSIRVNNNTAVLGPKSGSVDLIPDYLLRNKAPNNTTALVRHPFSSGSTHITTSKRLALHADSPTLGGPKGLFTAPSSQIDDLVRRASSRADIEFSLGLERGALNGGDLIRFDVSNPFSRNLRLPTSGNIHFRPGAGVTTGNISEGIINSPLLTDPGVTKSVLQGL